MKKFEVGKTYYGWTQKGEIRLMKVTAISTNKTHIKAIYHNNNEAIMQIHDANGEQWVEADKRYKVVVTADEYKPKADKDINVKIVDRATGIRCDFYSIKESALNKELSQLKEDSYYKGYDIYVNNELQLSL